MNPILLCLLCGVAFMVGAICVVFCAVAIFVAKESTTKEINKRLLAYWDAKNAADSNVVDLLARIAIAIESQGGAK